MEIKNKVIFVTGGNRGIGKAISEALAREGGKIYVCSRTVEKEFLSQLVQLGAAHAEHLSLDLSSKEGIERFLLETKSKNISPDILVNNAGQLTGGLFEEQKIDDIYSMLQVNLLGLIHLTHSLLPEMLKKGSGKIVNNSSVSGIMHFPCATTYTAAKTGVVAFTESLRQELVGTGVTTLLLITPGVKTRMFDQINDLYSKNMDLSFAENSITPEEWALRICESIKNDDERLLPKGATGLSLKVAQHLPGLFEKIIGKKFQRK